MEEQRRRQAAAGLVIVDGGGREEHADDAAARGSSCCCCNLCGDVGFREALLPCGARGCSRLQHTYCGSRYCPEVVDDVKRWRCEWCAREDGNRPMGEEKDEQEEEEDSSRKKSRRAPTSRSSSPPEIIKQASPPPEKSTDKEGRSPCHREERRESTSHAARAHVPRATSPGASADGSVETDLMIMHKDKQSINTRSGGGSRALDRWKNLAKRTRLGGKKYKLLADVLC